MAIEESGSNVSIPRTGDEGQPAPQASCPSQQELHELELHCTRWARAARDISAGYGGGPDPDGARAALVAASSALNRCLAALGLAEVMPRDTFNPTFCRSVLRAVDTLPVAALVVDSLLRRRFGAEAALAGVDARTSSAGPGQTFVSYATVDAVEGRLVYEWFRRSGPAWIDQVDLDVHARTETEVDEAVRAAMAAADRLCICYSLRWLAHAGYSQTEFLDLVSRCADGGGVEVLIVALDETPVLSELEHLPIIGLAGLFAGETCPWRPVEASSEWAGLRAGEEAPATAYLHQSVRPPTAEEEERMVATFARSVPAVKRIWEAYDADDFSAALREVDALLADPVYASGSPLLDHPVLRSEAIYLRAIAFRLRAQLAHNGRYADLFEGIGRAWGDLQALLALEPVDRSGAPGWRLTPREVQATAQHYLDGLQFALVVFFKRWTPESMASFAPDGPDFEPGEWEERLRRRVSRLGSILLRLKFLRPTLPP